ncbi:MAG: AAA family ATPase [Elusimicrobia bacterium]|nr:AAA family ATPase [Elusimicrobiota bacterium]
MNDKENGGRSGGSSKKWDAESQEEWRRTQLMKRRKLELWFRKNWLYIVIVAGVFFCFVLPIAYLQTLNPETKSFILGVNFGSLPIYIIQTLIFVGFLYWLHYGGGPSRMRGTKINLEMDAKIKFTDVIGLSEAKREALEVVQLIKDRARVKRIGGKIVKGLLMIGPPGCGKTLLAKAIATEAGIPFLAASGAEFIEVFVGVGAARVRKLFKDARLYGDAYGGAIVFLDELDVIGRQRVSFDAFGGGQELNSTTNQLLTEMDGIEPSHNVVVIGATNVVEEALDPALLRPGRFDRKIFVDRPNLEERQAMFDYYLKRVQYDPAIEVGRLARKAVYKTPAEIQNIVQEAALISARNGSERIGYREISQAIERIELGVAHRLNMTPHEKERVAFHEAGHLVVLYLHHPSDEVFKASIISRGGALGVVHHQPREEMFTKSKDDLYATIKVALAGYVSEKIRYGVTSSGVASDFANAMAIAHDMVWRFGMSRDGFFGDFNRIPKAQLSEAFKEKLNNESQHILNQAERETGQILKAEWKLVERFANELIAKEELEYDEIDVIFKEYGRQPVYRIGGEGKVSG